MAPPCPPDESNFFELAVVYSNMNFDEPSKNFFSRSSIRIKDFDYGNPGYYFVTICSYEKRCLFGRARQGLIELSDIGIMIQFLWENIGILNRHVELDEFVIMPNHLHGILRLSDQHRASNPTEGMAVPCPYSSSRQINSTKPGSLQTIIRSFKGACTKGARFHHLADRVWQRGYHEHIVRKEASLMKIRQYIRDNPTKWQRDELFVHDTGHGNVISLSLR
jgi:putative transposase